MEQPKKVGMVELMSFINRKDGSFLRKYSRATCAMALSSNIISAMPSWSTSTSSMYTISVRALVFRLQAAFREPEELF